MSELELAEGITDPSPDPPAGEVEAGADAGTLAAAAEGEAAQASAPEEAAAAPAWSPDDPAFRDAVAAEAGAVAEQRLRQILEEAVQARPDGQTDGGEPPAFNLDPLEPGFGEQFAGFLAQRDEYLLEQFGRLLTPVLSREETERAQEGEQRMRDVLADIGGREGELLGGNESTKAVEMLSSVFFRDTAGRYGHTPRAAETALQDAYRLIRKVEQAADQRGFNRAESELAGLSGARRESAGAGDGTLVALDARGNELDFADAFMAKRGLA